MKHIFRPLIPGGLLLAMFCLILDSRCAANSAGQAIRMCLQTVIPGLFPMFVLSGLLIPYCSRGVIPEGLERKCCFPEGSGSLFLIGLTGGFPVGAQAIQQAVLESGLSRKDGARMLGLCNHCGPAFLFGIVPRLFSGPEIPLILFLIQAECALLLARYWPGTTGAPVRIHTGSVSITDCVRRAIGSMGMVCAWIVLASVLCGFLEQWLFPMLPPMVPVILRGVLELTGGVLSLAGIPSEGLRFLLCCAMINWGGICVHLQIQSLATRAKLSTKCCVQQKLMQAILSVLLGAGYLVLGTAGLLIPLILLIPGKKLWQKQEKPCIMSAVREVSNHAVPKENAQILPVLPVQHQA